MPSPAIPELPPDTRWHPVNDLPPMAFDHGPMVEHACTRLAAKLSYTNIGFALAPTEFALSTLRNIYSGALGHPVDATNLQRVLERRNVITRTGTTARSGRSGGRPAALYKFTESRTGSPTNSPRCARPGESAGFLTALLSNNGRMDLGSVAPAAGAEWIGSVPHEDLSGVSARNFLPTIRSTTPRRASSTPRRAPSCAAATSRWRSSG